MLIVLFAAFVDLLVPNNALQKYVRMTISLIILLTILGPIIQLLKPGLDIRESAFEAMEAGSGGMPPLSDVLEEGNRLRLAAESRSVRLAEAQIAGQIRQQVSRAFGVAVASVEVGIHPGEEGLGAEIRSVRIKLDSRPETDEPSAPASDSAGPSPAVRGAAVASVKPVEIAVGGDRAEGKASRETVAGTGEADPAEQARLAEEIAIRVGEWWGLDMGRVKVDWTHGAD